MKNILMIGTGGTIASEMSPEGLTPELTPSQLLRCVPAIRDICMVDCLNLFSLDSTNITPAHWLQTARAICEHYADYDGFVISHGTDTMAYTAAALSYLVQSADKPIMLTGAQKPINYDSTDSKLNLTDAFVCAASGELAGVNIVFSGRVILGTHARKTCSKSFAAFSSINYPDVGILLDHRLVRYIPPLSLSRPLFYDVLDEKVGLVKMVPGLDPGVLDYMLSRNDALIIECFGVGGLPAYEDDRILRASAVCPPMRMTASSAWWKSTRRRASSSSSPPRCRTRARISRSIRWATVSSRILWCSRATTWPERRSMPR